MSTTPCLSLLDLNKDCLGAIYDHLDTKEDRMSFFHTCKALHDTLRSKIYKLVLHVPEQGNAGVQRGPGSSQEQQSSVEDALRTFPGTVLRSIKLVGPIPREWRSLDGPLKHAEHVTELDVAQSVDYELLDVGTLCRLFPNLTSLNVFDKWSTTGEGSFKHLQDLKHLRQLTLLQPFSTPDPPEDLGMILATCHGLESLTLSTFPRWSHVSVFPRCSMDLKLHSRSVKHICILHMHATSLGDLCWHVEHNAFPNLESITFGKSIILDLAHRRANTEKIKYGARLFATNLVRVPDKFTVLGSSGVEFVSRTVRGPGFVDFAPSLSALIEGGLTQVVENVSSLCLNYIYLHCPLVSLLGQAFANVRQLTLQVTACVSGGELIQFVTEFPLLCHLKLQGVALSFRWQSVLPSIINAAETRNSQCGLHIELPDTSVVKKDIKKVVQDRALLGGLSRVRISFSGT
ncbi:hypothetical protein DUNSADRAFT_9348 [Dunaliella salina]|uniref:F-box domain-containing protein n=1 Tax=Dunaliella salina TaxID=3046 RepID=A0ABQ7H5F7_DUNSA|nr:hypothetical protein DUNSADRAFT_9348 [Dunaliella salina]|eukprot:KAF5842089.1 hypothetical protein DUNSADRAFT_9348 [Dunaliella salina]